MEQHLIKSIYVEKLFGLYTYDFDSEKLNSSAVILYGDNGVGKSTLLRLAFHLLSPANNGGHRTALYTTNFELLKVELTSGYILTAKREEKELGHRIMVLDIIKDKTIIARWNYRPDSPDGRRIFINDEVVYINDHEIYESFSGTKIKKSITKNPLRKVTSQRLYLETIRNITPVTFILNADRRLDGDTISDPDDEVELRQAVKMGTPKRIQDLVLRSREIALSQALNAATKWIARKAVQGTNQGTDNVHSTYVRILKQLVSSSNSDESSIKDDDIDTLKENLKKIGSETHSLAKYELTSFLEMSEFEKILSTDSTSQKGLSAELLKPYIESLDGRLAGVRSIYKILDKFISTINELLTDKEISFQLSRGFLIINKFGEVLQPAQLSSGEQQLLLLFCYVLVARDTPSIFMIDEPEISLNIKWQRIIINSLLDITDGANIQFIFASHSLEIISQHRNRVVKLENKNV
ncbi:AAA family ATPase [Aeromonas hydrophila]|uniref:AAA family ATPase n=1 Tax=Aeromonas hydrophila TaxID=644 RepID=UPI00207CDB62|nr:AAA family ATPase [Aeromonas hydrophila]MCO4210911.1 ATP-binding protein [Aeromonas hydrophila]HDX8441761.1 ATP-binding protein [Aeromonas hydrophila]HDX8633025.1 ATP-binding protein [Aeromonas hydrophila]